MSLDVFSKLPFLLFWSLFYSFLFRWFRQWCGPSTSVGLCLGCRNQKLVFCSFGFPKQLDLPFEKECSVPVCQCASVPVCCFAVAVVLLVAVRRHRTLLHHKAAWSIHKGLKSAGGFIGPNYINFSFNHIQPYQKHSKTIAAIAWLKTSSEISLGILAGSSRRQGRRRPVGAVVVDSIAFSFRHAAGRHGANICQLIRLLLVASDTVWWRMVYCIVLVLFHNYVLMFSIFCLYLNSRLKLTDIVMILFNRIETTSI